MSGFQDTTRIPEPARDTLIGPASRWRERLKGLANVWTPTEYDEAPVARYAEKVMLGEVRKGITVMAVLSLIIQIAAIVLYQKLGVHGSFLYTYGLLALLSIHIIISTRFVSDLSSLNLLGMVLLIFTAVAIMTIAHRTGSLNAGLLSSIVLLFMVMPIMPWGLREACVTIGLIYVTVTISFLSVDNKFAVEALWTVQFLIIASAATAMLTIARNTIVRKNDIRMRFELEDAHRELQLVSTLDPLTGAWNRRFIEQNFKDYAERRHAANETVQIALMDINRFKYFNDSFGHDHGDLILIRLARTFIDSLPGDAHLVRLGGDEFLVVFTGSGFRQLVTLCLDHLATDPVLLKKTNGEAVTVAVGFAEAAPDSIANLDVLYKAADEELYRAKSEQRRTTPGEPRESGATPGIVA